MEKSNREIAIKNKLESEQLFKISRFKEVIKRTKPHKHDAYLELIYLSEGAGFHWVDTQKFQITPPVVYFLSGQLHYWEMTAVPKGYVMLFREGFFNPIKQNDLLNLIDSLKETVNVVLSPDDQLDFIFSEMEKEYKNPSAHSASYEAAKSGANAYSQLKDYLVIRAAFDGVITNRNVDPGTLVGKGSSPLLVLENLSKLRVRVAVPEIYTSAIPESTSINFTVDAEPSKKYSASLARKSNQIDSKTRTELWEFEVANTNQELKSGMYGSASFILQRSDPSFVIPYSALVTNLERNFVIRILDGKTEWVGVRSGISMNEQVEIFGNLQESDKLVLKANDELKPGVMIIPK